LRNSFNSAVKFVPILGFVRWATTLQNYIADQQKHAALRKETVANRSLTVGLGKYYGQKFGMNQDKDCYEWLGDYPKVAAERGSKLVTAGEIG
jgi:hypothetical protein